MVLLNSAPDEGNMENKNTAPPKLAKLILSRLSGYEKNFALSHALDEEYAEYRIKKGRFRTWIWCWFFVMEILLQYGKLALIASMDMLYNYLLLTFRTIFRHKVFSFINIAGFTFGMVCFLLIFLYVRYERSYDSFFEHADRIYRVITRSPGNMYLGSDYYGVTNTPLARTLEDEVSEVEAATKIGFPRNIWLGQGEQGFYVRVLHADENFFKVFSFELIEGDRETVLNGPNRILLSREVAEKYFKGESPVGQTILDGFLITGIFENTVENSHLQMDCVISFVNLFPVQRREQVLTDWDNTSFFTYAKLREGSDPNFVERKIGTLINKYDPAEEEKMAFLQLLSQIHLNPRINFEFSPTTDVKYLYLFTSIAFLILIVACINYMNLSTARASLRAKEIGVRKVVGAQRRQLIRQFMIESISISWLALLFALMFAGMLLPMFASFVERKIQMGTLLQGSLLLQLAAIASIVGLAAGLYPAIFLSSFRPVSIIKGTLSRFAGKGRLRSVLVVLQFSITVILMVSCLIVSQQMRYLRTKDIGFNRDNIVIIRVADRGIKGNLVAFRNDLIEYPGIAGVAISNDYPTRIGSGFLGTYQDEQGAEVDFHTHWFAVDYDFLDLYDVKIMQGRGFSKEFSTDAEEAALVNETFVKQAGWKNPVGKRISTSYKDDVVVVGVTNDFNYHSLRLDIKPLIIHCDPSMANWASVRIKGSDGPAAISHIKKTYNQYMTKFPFEFRFLDDVYAQMYRGEKKLGTLFGLFSVIAFTIACLGLFGLASHACERRTKEIGVRKVLGATISDILNLLLMEFARPVVIANLLAWPIAYLVMRGWLNSFEYRTGISVSVFMLAGMITLIVAALTVSLHAVRAAKADPSFSLRYE
jgi:putative ABC transport system permease protein